MIITCNKCSTRFTLDDSLVAENGSKVRCSVCKDIFTAYPLPREPEQPAAPVADFDSAPALADIPDFEMEDPEFSFDENEFDLNGGDGEKGPDQDQFEFETDEISEDITIEADEHQDTDFDGIEFESLKDEPEDLTLDMDEIEPDLKIEEDTDFLEMDFDDPGPSGEAEGPPAEEDVTKKEEDEFELEFDMEEDDGLSIAPDEPGLDILEEGETLSLEQTDSEKDLDEISPEDDFSEYDAVLEQDTEPDETPDEEDLIGEESVEEEPDQKDPVKEKSLLEKSAPLMDLPERRSRRKKKSVLSLPVLLLVLIFFLTAGAYVASIMTGYKIPHLSDFKIPFLEKYLSQTDSAAKDAKPVPNESSVNGRFVSNTASGTLFVITGRVDNPSGLAFNHIEVQGTLSTKEIPAAKIQKAFCGNIITEEMLKSGKLAEIMKLLEVKEGAHNSNMNIKPGAGVPFMIVFSDLPEKLQNFNVKVVGFEKATGN
ncbi:MAG: zinc-ribbon domain-containing protein [Desulfobacteraceae bacterium]|nr:zinc-ribbon domain-containing protein [Desulfobacteraceae bacterium]